MVEIFVKDDWQLNPDNRVVNAILKRCEENDGICPCQNFSVDPKCPCSDYRENDVCHCSLYVKK